MKGLKTIAREWMGCQKCPLHEGRNTLVFGDGPQDAKIMIVGEAPGENEDLQGLPFVGQAGEVLNDLLKEAGIRRESVFLTNVVACRPPGNREPTNQEISACLPRLHDIIYTIDPLIIVAMGNVASWALTKKRSITANRGDISVISIPGVTRPVPYPVLLTLHPAFLLRNPDIGKGGWVDLVVEDLKLAAKVANSL